MAYEEQVGMSFWNPEQEGETVEGVVEEIIDGDYGKQYTIKKDDGEQITTSSHAYLQNRMKKVKVGDKVKMVYEGEEAPTVKGRNPTKKYKVFIDK